MNNIKSFPPEWNEFDSNNFGGWPSNLPKPSVGGYGYTEQGDQTVITWDGNTEGHYIINHGELNYVHVSNKTPASIVGGSLIVGNETFDIRDNSVIKLGESGYDVQLPNFYVIMCIFNDNTVLNGITIEKKGIYFVGLEGHISSLTYGTPDIVHKIDEKYLPGISDAPSVDGTYTITCTVTNGEPAYSWKPAP